MPWATPCRRIHRPPVGKRQVAWNDDAAALEGTLQQLWSGSAPVVAAASAIDVVGHRVVHGGPRFDRAVRIIPEVTSAIAAAAEFAPLHNRAELDGVALVEKLLGATPQIAAGRPVYFTVNVTVSATSGFRGICRQSARTAMTRWGPGLRESNTNCVCPRPR